MGRLEFPLLIGSYRVSIDGTGRRNGEPVSRPAFGQSGLTGRGMAAISRSNRELLAAARRGDAAAADALARALADLAWTACRRVTSSGADAEAAFNDVMTALRADG